MYLCGAQLPRRFDASKTLFEMFVAFVAAAQ